MRKPVQASSPNRVLKVTPRTPWGESKRAVASGGRALAPACKYGPEVDGGMDRTLRPAGLGCGDQRPSKIGQTAARWPDGEPTRGGRPAGAIAPTAAPTPRSADRDGCFFGRIAPRCSR